MSNYQHYYLSHNGLGDMSIYPTSGPRGHPPYFGNQPLYLPGNTHPRQGEPTPALSLIEWTILAETLHKFDDKKVKITVVQKPGTHEIKFSIPGIGSGTVKNESQRRSLFDQILKLLDKNKPN